MDTVHMAANNSFKAKPLRACLNSGVRAHMNIFALFALALYPLTVAAELRCPELPPSVRVHWEGHYGPGDEVVCLAVEADGTSAFILFRGSTPPLVSEGLTRAEVGMAFGQPVRWYEQGSDRDYQAEIFPDASPHNSIRVFVPRNPAGTFLERVKLVGALSKWPQSTP